MSNTVLRFIAASDLHYTWDNRASVDAFEDALSQAYAYAQSQAYRRIDALYVAGDFVTNGTEREMRLLKRSLTACVRPETMVTLLLGSHECENEDEDEEKAAARLKEIFGMDADSHKVINGYDFIAISSVKCEFSFFDDAKRAWLRERLAVAAARHPYRAIFVFQHPHIRETVCGSIRWGMSDLTDILMDYPQVINFSGHSHAPVNNPRSLHQRYFTSVNTGSFWGIDLDEYDKPGGPCPHGEPFAAQFQIVEAKADGSIDIKPYDARTDMFFPLSWTIDTPWKPESFRYIPELCAARASAPVFPEDAAISLTVSGAHALATFPQASCTEPYVKDYHVILRRTGTDLVIKQRCVSSRYYINPLPRTVECAFDGLMPGEYSLVVRARNFWNCTSEDKLSSTFIVP
jgi:hypothetical protein